MKHSLPGIKTTLPAKQWHLSETGRFRCNLLAEKISPYSPDTIVSSPEPKARETAQIVADNFHLSVDVVHGLREHNRDNYLWAKKEEFEQDVANFFKFPHLLVMGQETADQAHNRFVAAINSVIEKYPVGNIVVIAHGTVITLFVSRLFELEAFTFWERLGMPSFVVLSLPQWELVTVVEDVEA